MTLACMDSQGLPIVRELGIGSATNTSTTTRSTATNHTVSVGDNFFSPDLMTIGTGDTVTWTWSGFSPHSVTFGDGVSSGVRTSGSFQRVFRATGAFSYSSAVSADSGMNGAIVVR
jgi:plastocyanin